tara:strand:+ start:631 stop:900 length:270 start_codon:yes stop_codon:yes gene_type:complete
MGRLVRTHSTYLEGLIKKLKKLANIDGVRTVTPGAIAKTKGKRDQLEIKISTRIVGGFKLIARKGTSVQEVFVLTKLKEGDINLILKNI